MRKLFFLIFLSFIAFSCKNERSITHLLLETIYKDSISIRAIHVDDNEVWFSGSNGKYGALDLKSKTNFKGKILQDSLSLEFRSLAKTNTATFILSVANPALLYKIDKDKTAPQLVYKEVNENVFYDSMQFQDDLFGIAMGDPISGCLNIIITKDGGTTWKKVSCDNLPKIEEGEAAFAASNTNVILRDNSIFIVSGGKKSRCFVSIDKGKSWQVYDTPIVQGDEMTGIFTADFYNDQIGFAAGGNYENKEDNSANKIRTKDGGKTWELVAKNKGFGYASCVQFVPNSNGKSIVSVGGTGIHVSNDFGTSWTKLSDEKDLYTFRFQNDSIAYAAGRNKIVRLKFN